MKIYSIILISLTFFACQSNLLQSNLLQSNLLQPNQPRPIDQKTYCKSGCDYLKTLKGQDNVQGCQESRDLVYPDGKIETCEEFCLATESNGRSLNPKCWTSISKCSQLEKICRSPV